MQSKLLDFIIKCQKTYFMNDPFIFDLLVFQIISGFYLK